MKNYCILLIFSLFISCQSVWKQSKSTNNASDLELKIIDSDLRINKNYEEIIALPEKKHIKYSIINNSSRKYVLVIDKSNFYTYSNIESVNRWSKINNDDSDKQLFQLGIKIGNKKKFINTGYNVINDYFANLPSLHSVVNENIVVINAGQSLIYDLEFTYPVIFNKTRNNGLVHFFLLDEPEFFNLFLFQDKNLILKNLNVTNKKKIKELKAEIYTGILQSNKIPIKLE